MRKILVSVFLVLLLSINVFAMNKNNEIPEEVLNVAQKGVSSVKSYCMIEPEKWGFSSKEEINNLVLGQGYHVRFIDADRVENATGNSIDELIDADIIDTWEFTLDIDGIPKIFLTVAYEGDAYCVTHFGGDATCFGDVKQTSYGVSQQSDLSHLTELIKNGGDYYFLVLENGEEFVVPVANRILAEGVNLLVEDSGTRISVADFTDSLKADALTLVENERGVSLIEMNDEGLPMWCVEIAVITIGFLMIGVYVFGRKYKR